MDTPLEIAFDNMEPSATLDAKIRDRVERLHRYFNHINSVHVTVSVPHRNPAERSREYHVRIEVRVPDKELVVSRDPGDRRAHFDAEIAVRDSFEAMEKQLEAHSQKVRGEVKTHLARPQGRVARIFHDHGFVATVDGREIYFHRNAVVGEAFDELGTGAPVELAIAEDESPVGPQATTVRPIRETEYMTDPVGET